MNLNDSTNGITLTGFYENKEFRCSLENFLPKNSKILDLDTDSKLKFLKTKLGIKYNLRVIKISRDYVEVSKNFADRFDEFNSFFRSKPPKPGEIIKVRVEEVESRSITVSYCGVVSLIESDELDFNNYNYLKGAFRVGDLIDVKVMDIELDRVRKKVDRLILSRKEAIREDYKKTLSKFAKGDLVYGKISYLREFKLEVLLNSKVSVTVPISFSQFNLNLYDPVVVEIEDIDLDNCKIAGKLVSVVNSQSPLIA